ncbi:hypothetical protein TgHK011_007831 [Trichoderma gracile]|nr:hypothetical protein TgHK011_007831 [Trichoderma gracile]
MDEAVMEQMGQWTEQLARPSFQLDGDCRKEPRPMYKTKESGNSSDSSQSRRCEMDQNGWDDRKSYFNEWHMIREEPRKDGIWGKRNSRISGLNTGLSGCAMS